MNKLVSLIYVSTATKLFNELELIELLKKSRIENLSHCITGMLLYHDGNIMQVIEGDEKEINQLYINLKNDDRHHGVIKLMCQPISEREFPEWSMSYLNVTSENNAGFSEFLSKKTESANNDLIVGRARKLLLNFREKLR